MYIELILTPRGGRYDDGIVSLQILWISCIFKFKHIPSLKKKTVKIQINYFPIYEKLLLNATQNPGNVVVKWDNDISSGGTSSPSKSSNDTETSLMKNPNSDMASG